MDSDSTLDGLIEKLDHPKKKLIKKSFKLAKEARAASDWKGPHLGSVITYKNKILAVGWNRNKETPLQKKFNKYRTFDANVYKNSEHAEIHAIRNLLHNYNVKEIDFSKVSVFVYREHKNHMPAIAKPCIACEMAMRDLGIKQVYYTGENSIIKEIYNEKIKKEKE